MIQFLRGTAAQFLDHNPLLGAGQPAIELDTGRMKVGNGTSNWTSLPYVGTHIYYSSESGTIETTQISHSSIFMPGIPDVSLCQPKVDDLILCSNGALFKVRQQYASAVYVTYLTTFGHHASKADTLATPRKINGLTFDGSKNISNFFTCDINVSSVNITAFTPSGSLSTYDPSEGSDVFVKFTCLNGADFIELDNIMLDVDETGRYPLLNHEGNTSLKIYNGSIHHLVFDGTNYVEIGSFIEPEEVEIPEQTRGPVTILSKDVSYPGQGSFEYDSLLIPNGVTIQVGDIIIGYLQNTVCMFSVTSVGSSVGTSSVGYFTHPPVDSPS